MIFRSGVFSRREGLTEAEFNRHWRDVHGELARHMPGVHRYLQNHIRERLFEVQPFPIHEVDGISRQWFDDIAEKFRAVGLVPRAGRNEFAETIRRENATWSKVIRDKGIKLDA